MSEKTLSTPPLTLGASERKKPNTPKMMAISSSLTLYTSAAFSALFSPQPGRWTTVNVQTGTTGPSIPVGTTVFTVVQIRDSAFSVPSTWTPSTQPFSDYYGASPEFTFVPGSLNGITYPPLWFKTLTSGGGNSTWPDGTYNMDFLGSGFRGAIMVGVPEPSSLALAGLGAAAMLLFRPRK